MAVVNWKEFFESDDAITELHIGAAGSWCQCALHELRPDLYIPPGGLYPFVRHEESVNWDKCPRRLTELGKDFYDEAKDLNKAGMKQVYEAIRDYKPEPTPMELW